MGWKDKKIEGQITDHPLTSLRSVHNWVYRSEMSMFETGLLTNSRLAAELQQMNLPILKSDFCRNDIAARELCWVQEAKTNGSIKQSMDKPQS